MLEYLVDRAMAETVESQVETPKRTLRPLYRELASLVQARLTCADRMNGHTEGDGDAAEEWFNKHEDKIEALVKQHLPSGSGFDCGTKIDFDESTGEKLVFTTEYHHMHESGMYDGWTEHRVIVTPSLQFGYEMKVTGRNRNDIKDYIHEQFSYALGEEVEIG